MQTILLPKPGPDSGCSVERALRLRRTLREFSGAALALGEISQLLWAAQGITGPEGLRTAPSAGAMYPLEVYVVAGNVAGLDPGIYSYEPAGHKLAMIAQGDRRAELARAALDQGWMARAPALIVFAAVEARTTGKYGQRGIGYIYLEAGHAAQNIFLQAAALGLEGAVAGAFEEERVAGIMDMPKDERPIYLMAVGRI
jgi:SagB-type dehydrogenase family enzyme